MKVPGCCLLCQEDDGEEDLTDEEGEALEVGDVVMVKPDNTLGILKKLDENLAQAHVAKHVVLDL